MRITVRELRRLIETHVGASPEYMKKEKVRERLQGVVTDLVHTGVLSGQDDVDEFFASADMSLKALKMIPFDVWQKMSTKKG